MVYSFYSYGVIYFIFYALTLVNFLNSSSLLVSWISLELNILRFCVLLFFYSENFVRILYYFLVQRLGSFTMLLYLIFRDQGSSTFSIVFVVSLALKLGFFPFHFWFYNVSSAFSIFSFFLLITWQKVPGIVVLFNSYREPLFVLFVINGIFGSAIVFFSSNLVNLLVSSSIYIGYWNMVVYCFYPAIFFYFYTFYVATLAMGFFCCSSYFSSTVYRRFLILAFFLIGLPPFNIFFMKIFFISLIATCFPFGLLFFILGVSFTCMIGYFRLFSKNLLYMCNIEHSGSNTLFLLKSGFFFLIFSMLVFC